MNNAGICPFADFFGIDQQLWDRVHEVNLRGVFLVSQAITRTMVDAGHPGRPHRRAADIAGVVWLLSQPEAGYVNGAELLVDGGLLVNLQ